MLWSRDVLAGVTNAVIAGDPGGRMIVAGTFAGTLDLAGNREPRGNTVILAAFAR